MLAALPWLGCVGSPEQEPTRALDHGTARGFALERMLGPEVGLDAPVPTATPGGWPAAAFDGSNFLVVWEDFRALRTVLYGARMTPDGTTLDPVGFPILDDIEPTDSDLVDLEPAIAFDGSNFLVVVRSEDEIRGVRVSPAGQVLDPGGFPISAAQAIFSEPAIAFDDSDFLVAWTQQSHPTTPDDGLYWARVAPDGTVLDPGGVLALPLSEPTQTTVSFDGTNYLLTWTEPIPDSDGGVTIRGARLSPAGTLLGQTGFPISPAGVYVFPESVAADFDGSNHVVAWATHNEYGTRYLVHATRITPQGAVLDADGIFLSEESSELNRITRMDMTAGNGRSFIAYSRNGFCDSGYRSRRVGIAVIEANGTVSGPPTKSPQRGLEAAIAASDAGALLVWRKGEEAFSTHPPIAAAVLDAQGMIVDAEGPGPAMVANAQEVRGVASDGHIFFVIWTDTRDVESEARGLYGVRVAADGTVLDAPAIQLDTAADEFADVANVIFDGANFLVTWAQHFPGGAGSNSQLRAVRVSPAGEVLDATPLHLPLAAPHELGMTPAAATDGTHTLLVAQGVIYNYNGLSAVLIDQRGQEVESAASVVPRSSRPERNELVDPAVAFDGAGYLVVWHDASQVFGRRVDASGMPVGEQLTIATGEGGIARSTVAFGHGHHLVVWQDANGLHGTRVTPDGQVLDAEGLPIAAIDNACGGYGSCCDDPAYAMGNCASVVAADGGFMVTWRAPTSSGNPSSPSSPSSMDLHGVVLSQDGEVLDSFALSAAPEREGMPMLAANAGGQVLAAYTRFVPEAPYSARRAHARLLTAPGEPYPEPEPEPGPDAGGAPAMPGPGEDNGGCSAGGSHAANGWLVLLALGGLLAWRRRPGEQAVRE